MKALSLTLATVILCSTSIASIANNANKPTMPQTKNQPATTDKFTNPNKIIAVTKKKAEIKITIKSNPTTGYSWFLTDYNHNLITPVKERYYPPRSELAGAQGYEVWTFKVRPQAFTVPQLTSITLNYMKPWVAANNTRKLTFTIAILKPLTHNK